MQFAYSSTKRKRFIIKVVLLFSLLIIGITAYFIWNKRYSQTTSLQGSIKSENAVLKNSLIQLDKSNIYESYVALFSMALNDYVFGGKKEDKENLERIKKGAKASFPTKFNEQDFVIPCLDKECKKSKITGDTGRLIEFIKTNVTSSDTSLKEATINSLIMSEQVGASFNDRRFSYLHSAFTMLKTIYNSSKKNTDRQAIVMLLKILDSDFPEEFKLNQELGFYEYK